MFKDTFVRKRKIRRTDFTLFSAKRARTSPPDSPDSLDSPDSPTSSFISTAVTSPAVTSPPTPLLTAMDLDPSPPETPLMTAPTSSLLNHAVMPTQSTTIHKKPTRSRTSNNRNPVRIMAMRDSSMLDISPCLLPSKFQFHFQATQPLWTIKEYVTTNAITDPDLLGVVDSLLNVARVDVDIPDVLAALCFLREQKLTVSSSTLFRRMLDLSSNGDLAPLPLVHNYLDSQPGTYIRIVVSSRLDQLLSAILDRAPQEVHESLRADFKRMKATSWTYFANGRTYHVGRYDGVTVVSLDERRTADFRRQLIDLIEMEARESPELVTVLACLVTSTCKSMEGHPGLTQPQVDVAEVIQQILGREHTLNKHPIMERSSTVNSAEMRVAVQDFLILNPQIQENISRISLNASAPALTHRDYDDTGCLRIIERSAATLNLNTLHDLCFYDLLLQHTSNKQSDLRTGVGKSYSSTRVWLTDHLAERDVIAAHIIHHAEHDKVMIMIDRIALLVVACTLEMIGASVDESVRIGWLRPTMRGSARLPNGKYVTVCVTRHPGYRINYSGDSRKRQVDMDTMIFTIINAAAYACGTDVARAWLDQVQSIPSLQEEFKDAQQYACQPCDLLFSDLYAKAAHQERVHTKDRFHECPTCEISFTSERGLDVHSPTCKSLEADPNRRRQPLLGLGSEEIKVLTRAEVNYRFHLCIGGTGGRFLSSKPQLEFEMSRVYLYGFDGVGATTNESNMLQLHQYNRSSLAVHKAIYHGLWNGTMEFRRVPRNDEDELCRVNAILAQQLERYELQEAEKTAARAAAPAKKTDKNKNKERTCETCGGKFTAGPPFTKHRSLCKALTEEPEYELLNASLSRGDILEATVLLLRQKLQWRIKAVPEHLPIAVDTIKQRYGLELVANGDEWTPRHHRDLAAVGKQGLERLHADILSGAVRWEKVAVVGSTAKTKA